MAVFSFYFKFNGHYFVEIMRLSKDTRGNGGLIMALTTQPTVNGQQPTVNSQQPKPAANPTPPVPTQQPPDAGKKEKMYPQSVVTELQRRLNVLEREASVKDVRIGELEAQNTAHDQVIADLKLAPDAEAKLAVLTKREGELGKRTAEYNAAKKILETEAKPIREAKLEAAAAKWATKSKGQITEAEFLAEGDEVKMRDLYAERFDPDLIVPPETDKKQPDDKEVKGSLPGLSGTGGASHSKTEGESEEETLKKMYPNSYDKMVKSQRQL
jgi:hypothetical protein